MNLFENLQLLKESKHKNTVKTINQVIESRRLNLAEFDVLKNALNKHNTLKDKMILSAISSNYYHTNEYEFLLKIYIKFKGYTSYNKPAFGDGECAYRIKINLLSENVEFLESTSKYSLNNYIESAFNKYFYEDYSYDDFYHLIMNIIETSKNDILTIIKTSNFIYKLTGKVKISKDDEYTLDLNESTKLSEDFDSSMPNWLKKAIRVDNQHNSIGHKDNKYNYALDTLKWNQASLNKIGKLDQYIKDGYIVAVLIDKSGDKKLKDYVVYCPALGIGSYESIHINNRNRRIDSMSMKALAPYITAIEIADANNNDIIKKRSDRITAQSGSIDRYNSIIFNDKTGRFLDKSGYVVEPNKYKKLLAQIHKDDYANRLEKLYTNISDVKVKIKEFVSNDNFLPDAKDDAIYYGVNYKNADYFDKLNKCYIIAVNNYKNALTELDNISNGKDTSFNDLSFKVFDRYVNDAEMNVSKIYQILDDILK